MSGEGLVSAAAVGIDRYSFGTEAVKYLVDADVLSEATKPQPQHRAIDWLRQHDADLVVNPIILGELEYGILLLPAGRKRTRLQQWFVGGVRHLNVVAIDGATAAEWAGLLADLKRKGRSMPVKDSLIAATARQHGLTVATRNTPDYRYAGVRLVDPFKA
jgi:predicted nucleic acid-binding protein